MIYETLNKLFKKENLTDIEIKETFDEINQGLAGSFLACAFIVALKSKGETIDEITNAIISSREAIKKINLPVNCENLCETVIFGKEDKNYIDVFLATDIICCANGLNIGRYALDKNKSFEILKCANIDFNNKNNDFDEFEKTNFFYTYLNNNEPFFKYTNPISKELKFKNILNIIEKFLNPYNAKTQIIGVDNTELVEKFANIALGLQNSNTIVFASEDKFPFISLCCETKVAEAWKNKIFSYNLNPDVLDTKTYEEKDILCQNNEENLEIILNVFQNKLKNAPYDLITINAGLALYISKKANSILDGINLAKKTIENNLALEKFNQIKNIYSA